VDTRRKIKAKYAAERAINSARGSPHDALKVPRERKENVLDFAC
jgi:hypothetical protein